MGVKQGRDGKTSHFLALSVNISETVGDSPMLLNTILVTNRKSHMRFRLAPRSIVCALGRLRPGHKNSCIYVGAAPWTHFHTNRAILKEPRWLIGSQWRLCRISDIQSHRRAPDIVSVNSASLSWDSQLHIAKTSAVASGSGLSSFRIESLISFNKRNRIESRIGMH